jgi:CelD/BcsL family acetyltransferase involved in cellulose biosynthesis
VCAGVNASSTPIRKFSRCAGALNGFVVGRGLLFRPSILKMDGLPMPQATPAAFDARLTLDDEAFVAQRREAVAVATEVRLAVHENLATLEQDWRAFEQTADGTVFQSFDWLSIWQRHIGSLDGVRPAIVTGRDSQGQLLFLLPLAVETRGFARRLTWLGTALCDYNGPLLAPHFSEWIDAAHFARLWSETLGRLRSHPRLSFDVVDFDKMQDAIGGQKNPFMAFGAWPHANRAYRTELHGDWETFYGDKRSSATRRRDRTKRKRLAESGEVRFVTSEGVDDLGATLSILIEQKSQSFAAMGVGSIFERPGHYAFYDRLATEPAMRGIVHVSRLDVGTQTVAANLGLIFRGRYYHLLASHDGGELSKFGPGMAHLHDLLRTAIERGCRFFDFTLGDERYKQEWCDAPITLYDHVRPMTVRGMIAAAWIFAVGRIKRFVKQTPAVWDAAYRVRALIGPLMKLLRR